MMNKVTAPASGAQDLKQMFEKAVGTIQPSKSAIARRRLPIVQRGVAISISSRIESEKRALADAAQALAQLWKISPHPAR